MKKNSQIHLYLETELIERLRNGAIENNISISELCRKKLRENSQLDRIEIMIGKIYKDQCIENSNKQ